MNPIKNPVIRLIIISEVLNFFPITLSTFKEEINPLILKGKNILIAAHGNSLRSLIKFLDNVSDEDIVKLEIPTGAPIHYIFNEDGNVIKKQNLID